LGILKLEGIESEYDKIDYIEVDADEEGFNKMVYLICGILEAMNQNN
jgi:iron uptake system EfeUOB component EfeO/EfeM